MKRILAAAAFAGLVMTGTSAIAQQDQSQQGSQTAQSDSNYSGGKSQAMKDCMARQKATNSGLTNLQMHTTCKNELKADKTHKDGNDLATGSQAGDKQPQQ